MKRLLEKISWKTRKLSLKVRFLDISLRDETDAWGFEFFTIQYKLKAYSALTILIRLPNKTTVKELTIDDWDFLFMGRFLYSTWHDLEEKQIWGSNLSKIEKIKYKLLSKLFR
jgi:hypothetical protein